MDTQNSMPTDGQKSSPPQLTKRAWVTPAFEQVALKDALTGDFDQTANDGDAQSS